MPVDDLVCTQSPETRHDILDKALSVVAEGKHDHVSLAVELVEKSEDEEYAAKMDDALVILLDIEELLSPEKLDENHRQQHDGEHNGHQPLDKVGHDRTA